MKTELVKMGITELLGLANEHIHIARLLQVKEPERESSSFLELLGKGGVLPFVLVSYQGRYAVVDGLARIVWLRDYPQDVEVPVVVAYPETRSEVRALFRSTSDRFVRYTDIMFLLTVTDDIKRRLVIRLAERLSQQMKKHIPTDRRGRALSPIAVAIKMIYFSFTGRIRPLNYVPLTVINMIDSARLAQYVISLSDDVIEQIVSADYNDMARVYAELAKQYPGLVYSEGNVVAVVASLLRRCRGSRCTIKVKELTKYIGRGPATAFMRDLVDKGACVRHGSGRYICDINHPAIVAIMSAQ